MTDEKKAKLRLDVLHLLDSKGIGRKWVDKLEVFNLPSGEKVMIMPEELSFDNLTVKVTREERYLTGQIAPSTQLATFNTEDLFGSPLNWKKIEVVEGYSYKNHAESEYIGEMINEGKPVHISFGIFRGKKEGGRMFCKAGMRITNDASNHFSADSIILPLTGERAERAAQFLADILKEEERAEILELEKQKQVEVQ